jgi:hypothetical protein
MIAESPASATATTTALHKPEQADARRTPEPLLSLGRVAATLQVILAARRAAHSEEHAYWYTIMRGM